MKNQKDCISKNLTALRQFHKFSQEEVAEKIGISRQAVAKWESGETVPDLINCDALASFYNVTVDDLLHYDAETEKLEIPPKGKHLFGAVKVGERGQIVLPKKAREIFHIKPGDLLVVLGDEDPSRAGIALAPGDAFLKMAEFYRNAMRLADTGEEEQGAEEGTGDKNDELA